VSHEFKLTEQSSTAEASRADLVARLFREHNDALVSFLALRLRSHQDAKEVAQEAYVRLLQLDRSDGAISLLRSYLFRIASNLAIDRLRHRNVRWNTAASVKAELFECFAPPNDVERGLVAAEELHLVRTALKELPEPCQRAFWMRFGCDARGFERAVFCSLLRDTRNPDCALSRP
jgi:RNA polymerase sigma-70 factor (ECF subfamily)